MSDTILTREQINDHQKGIYRNAVKIVHDTNSGFTVVDDMSVEIANHADALRDSHMALHDALDAALERERVAIADRDKYKAFLFEDAHEHAERIKEIAG